MCFSFGSSLWELLSVSPDILLTENRPVFCNCVLFCALAVRSCPKEKICNASALTRIPFYTKKTQASCWKLPFSEVWVQRLAVVSFVVIVLSLWSENGKFNPHESSILRKIMNFFIAHSCPWIVLLSNIKFLLTKASDQYISHFFFVSLVKTSAWVSKVLMYENI